MAHTMLGAKVLAMDGSGIGSSVTLTLHNTSKKPGIAWAVNMSTGHPKRNAASAD